MFDTYRNVLRLIAILRILARHGVVPFEERFWPVRLLSFLVSLNPATWHHRRHDPREVRLRQAIEELGATFIKFGQALSTRMDVLPDEIGREMKKLQDAVPPFPFEQVKEIVERNLGGPLRQFYTVFDSKPVASASIAQVHWATTREGRQVAVKVRRPRVAEVVEDDIRVLMALADLVEEYIPEWQRFRARKVVEEFADTIRSEMDFRVEASRAQQFRQNFQGDPLLKVPEVIWNLSTPEVLTMEWVSGLPIDELATHPELHLDPLHVARNIITVFFKQVFRDGYFHADQHPGNIFVQNDGTIVMLDFGIVGHISLQTRIWLAEMLAGFLNHDYHKVARAHLDAGYVPPDTNMDAFEDACRQIGEPIFGQPLKEISIAHLLEQLFQVTERFQMEVQPQLLLLQKTMLTLEGVGRELGPDLNVWMLAEPLIKAWMIDHMGPKGRLRQARDDFGDLAHLAGQLPKLLTVGLERIVHDRVRIKIDPSSLDRLERRLAQGNRRQNATIGGGLLFVGGAILFVGNASAWLYVPPFFLATLSFLRGMGMIR